MEGCASLLECVADETAGGAGGADPLQPAHGANWSSSSTTRTRRSPSLYGDYFCDLDPTGLPDYIKGKHSRPASASPGPAVFDLKDVVDYGSLMSSEFYNDFWRSGGDPLRSGGVHVGHSAGARSPMPAPRPQQQALLPGGDGHRGDDRPVCRQPSGEDGLGQRALGPADRRGEGRHRVRPAAGCSTATTSLATYARRSVRSRAGSRRERRRAPGRSRSGPSRRRMVDAGVASFVGYALSRPRRAGRECDMGVSSRDVTLDQGELTAADHPGASRRPSTGAGRSR